MLASYIHFKKVFNLVRKAVLAATFSNTWMNWITGRAIYRSRCGTVIRSPTLILILLPSYESLESLSTVFNAFSSKAKPLLLRLLGSARACSVGSSKLDIEVTQSFEYIGNVVVHDWDIRIGN